MLAFAWPWGDAAGHADGLAARLGASLCAGIGGAAGSAQAGPFHIAYRPLRGSHAEARAWRPAILPDGKVAAFHGYFDNAEAIAAELGCAPGDLARLYALAIERWGDDGERRIIGEYCAIIADPAGEWVRLSRSPFRAPPFHYHADAQSCAAASVPRALLAAGVERRLDQVRAADSAMLNFTDREATWLEGVRRVPLGHCVTLRPGAARELHQWYDLFACPDVRLDSMEAYVARADELLREGIGVCLKGSRTPASTLSSGLDSSQVVARAAPFLAPGQKLPTFTFHPESGWDGIVENGMNGNERPMVEAFAAMHPHVEPHFTDNAGYEHDYKWNEFFHLMGGAPSGLCNMYVFHGLFAGARDRGCDRLLLAEWGNFTFSDRGEWAYVEYLLSGRWRELWLALRRRPNDPRTMVRKFLALCVMPLLPDKIALGVMRVWHRGYQRWVDLMSPLSKTFRQGSGADRRYDDSGLQIDRYHPRNRRHAQKLIYQNEDAEASEIYQAFEQLYGVAQRDPTAHRPLIEFCFGLPVECFYQNGEWRWLAKEMARGIMPEEQRVNQLNGRWDSDWHLRITRRRDDWIAQLDRLEEDPQMAEMFDIPRLRQALIDLPDHTTLDRSVQYPAEFAVPRGLLTARFVAWMDGRNTA